MLPDYRLSTRDGYDTQIARDIDNRPMSSRSQVLFRSNTEVKHVLRQHCFQFDLHHQPVCTASSRRSLVEDSACVAGWNSVRVGTTIPVQGASRT